MAINHYLLRPLVSCTAVAAVLFFSGPNFALTRATSADGHPYVSGGIGAAEARLLRAERNQYTLRILTAAKPSGAYLADVHVRISDEKGHDVYNATLDGPWLMIDLPAGRYVVEAERRGQTQHRSTSISTGHGRELLFRFSSDADVIPAVSSAAAAH